jgi:hypothetical protein
MKTIMRFASIGLVIIGAAIGVVLVVTNPSLTSSTKRERGNVQGQGEDVRPALHESRKADPVPLYSAGFVDDSGFGLVTGFKPLDYDCSALEAHREVLRSRGQRAIAQLLNQISQLPEVSVASDARFAVAKSKQEMLLGLCYMFEGQFEDASLWFDRSWRDGSDLPRDFRSCLLALQGVAGLRRGEIENCVSCVGPSSCIFPIAPEAQHQLPSGSRAAMGHFLDYLKQRPDDLGVRWLLNVAAMTVGEYPGGLPKEYLISLDRFRSPVAMRKFSNIAGEVGLDTRGPNMAGGSAFDDFTGDGLPDVFFSSCDWDRGAALFTNLGNGRFEERAASKASLKSQDMSLNLQHADFDNDGKLDVLILRGGWEGPARMSLLRSKGGGIFEDVTLAAGLGEPIASQSAAWGDYDNDGKLDLYVVGEFHQDRPDSRNLCRLYHNNGDGTFTNVAAKAGVLNEGWAKGAAWGDYDDDGKPDLYVSNMWGPNRLYHNKGDGTFDEVAADLGVADPFHSFSCWFWDYDNDGKLDLFVCGYFARLNDIVADYLGQRTTAERPRLYHNLGNGRFEDATAAAGLERVILPMGTNFADIDNDGFLDMYLGTGQPAYMTLAPNLMLKNIEGRHFVDVTDATGTGHLQKGHGVSFADWDGDGDLDLFVQMGGVAPGDRSHNVLFQNPGSQPARHWLGVKLVGVQTNRAAFGARVQADLRRPDGTRRSLFRVVGTGSSFGGNSLVVHLGLDQETEIELLAVSWPVSRLRQEFHRVPADQTIEIVEGSQFYHRLVRPAFAAAGRKTDQGANPAMR